MMLYINCILSRDPSRTYHWSSNQLTTGETNSRLGVVQESNDPFEALVAVLNDPGAELGALQVDFARKLQEEVGRVEELALDRIVNDKARVQYKELYEALKRLKQVKLDYDNDFSYLVTCCFCRQVTLSANQDPSGPWDRAIRLFSMLWQEVAVNPVFVFSQVLHQMCYR